MKKILTFCGKSLTGLSVKSSGYILEVVAPSGARGVPSSVSETCEHNQRFGTVTESDLNKKTVTSKDHHRQ